MLATFLASSLLILLHLGGWPVCWGSWLPPWHAAFAVNAAKPNLTMRRTCSRSLQWSLGSPHDTRFECRKCFSVFLPPFPSLMSIRNFPCRDGIMQWHCSRILCLMQLRCIVHFLMVLVSPHNRKSDQGVQRLNIRLSSLLLRLARLGLEVIKGIKRIQKGGKGKGCQAKPHVMEHHSLKATE